mmetsp:Transcript_14801/g.44593  ORF Transcript_14801/g.44593 Transcript_14801/m.44593 type:complete len:256 (-) Transcript_14801:1002-1769(-)|eukprot:CAMPEP_0118867454 /NCGR_PEP_ID=MMETSP1163-20130328/11053_1 /TAXON_ID=124430 /ORGANISM="Phaeomonas parva, Strain CCMP2877" /LENGTH=255 /DNA_ID=CAMNT_0006801869 /DNA_START=95 /DNA_END=862 /DNA_ORIENTATION=+
MMSADEDTLRLLKQRMVGLVEEKKEQQKVLQAMNELNLELTTELEGARDKIALLAMQNEQLKLEVSNKWRVEERNEWMHLVDSLQKDRAALQDENEELLDRLDALDAGNSGGDHAGGGDNSGGNGSSGGAGGEGGADHSTSPSPPRRAASFRGLPEGSSCVPDAMCPVAQDLKRQVDALRAQLKSLRATGCPPSPRGSNGGAARVPLSEVGIGGNAQSRKKVPQAPSSSPSWGWIIGGGSRRGVDLTEHSGVITV